MDEARQMPLSADQAGARSATEVLADLDADGRGLTGAEAAARLQRLGPNEIREPKRHPIVRFLRYFWGPIPGMIEAACVLAALAARWDDFGVILALLAINGGVSYWHERKAGKAIQALKDQLAPKRTCCATVQASASMRGNSCRAMW